MANTAAALPVTARNDLREVMNGCRVMMAGLLTNDIWGNPDYSNPLAWEETTPMPSLTLPVSNRNVWGEIATTFDAR